VKNPFLVGTKIYLRPLERADAAAIVGWFNDPDVTRYSLRYRPLNLLQEEQWLEQTGRDEGSVALGIALREDDRLIGSTGFHQLNFKDRGATFGIMIGDKAEWDKGYGSEATRLMVRYAFETLNLHRVTLYVFEYNARAIRTYEKIGFCREGLLRQENWREGRYWDTVVMGILRDEWLAAQAGS
jgi:RimJ/RimL family protein N-acetyltransferase